MSDKKLIIHIIVYNIIIMMNQVLLSLFIKNTPVMNFTLGHYILDTEKYDFVQRYVIDSISRWYLHTYVRMCTHSLVRILLYLRIIHLYTASSLTSWYQLLDMDANVNDYERRPPHAYW